MRFIKNLGWAWQGIRSFFKTEANGRIQGVIALLIVAASIGFKITTQEWIWVLGCIALVLCLEMMNSAIEKLCNLITTDYNPEIKTIKDISAGAVLLASIASVIVGLIIFVPYLLQLFKQ